MRMAVLTWMHRLSNVYSKARSTLIGLQACHGDAVKPTVIVEHLPTPHLPTDHSDAILFMQTSVGLMLYA